MSTAGTTSLDAIRPCFEGAIPAVMATRTATRAIRNGQLVSVDGSAGTVTLEE